MQGPIILDSFALFQNGTINARNFYDVYREYTLFKFSAESLSGEIFKECPACEKNMVCLHFDGNRKLFRYKKK